MTDTSTQPQLVDVADQCRRVNQYPETFRDPICHLADGHTGAHIGLATDGTLTGFHYSSHRATIDETLAAASRPTEPPTSVPAMDGTPDAARGRVALDALANGMPWPMVDPFAVADGLAAIRERVAADETAIRAICRTLRAYAANQYSESRQFGPTFAAMVRDGSLIHHAWHEGTEVTAAWPIDPLDVDGRAPDASRVLVVRTAPERAHLMAYGATVADMIAAWAEIRHVGATDAEALAEALAEAATDNGWCPVYDRLCDDLNAHVPSHWWTEFRRNEPPRTYHEVSGTVTVTFNVSTLVGAIDESDALDNAEWSDVLYELRRQLDGLDYSHDMSRYADVDVDSAYDTGDLVD